IATDPSRKPAEGHAVVGCERPQRIGKSRRPVVLDEEMPDPGGTVSADKRTGDEPQIAGDERPDHAKRRQARPEIMDGARLRPRMLLKIIRPEIAVALDRAVGLLCFWIGHGRIRV